MQSDLGKHALEHFLELCKIPRGSGNERRVSDHLARFANRQKLDWIQDEACNVLVQKKGSPGLEEAPYVILQAHMDMVCVAEGAHDFERDPIAVYDGGDGYLRAQGTSLGADDGVGVALIMAILAKKELRHPPLLALFTADEERGLNGARALNMEDIQRLTGTSDLSTARLINIDEEEEGRFCGGCAGGLRSELRVPVLWEAAPTGYVFFEATIDGLTSGHSGMCIGEGRANGILLMARFLDLLSPRESGIVLAEIAGGDRENAIPAWSSAVLGVPAVNAQRLRDEAAKAETLFRGEYNRGKQPLEPGLRVCLKACGAPARVFSADTRDKAIAAGLLLPNGVLAHDADDPGLAETSNNVGIARVEGDNVTYISAVRSSVDSRKYLVQRQMEALASQLGGTMLVSGDYPGWVYHKNTPLKQLFTHVYQERFGKQPELMAIHAGLECGQLAKLFGDIDMIAFGPTIRDAHTTKERLDIASVSRAAEFLAAVLFAL